MKKISSISFFILVAVILSSCSVIGGIFKAGVGVGIGVVVLVVILILWLVSRGRR
ncbi:MAG: phosphatidate cytidylyltransferase [Bacteroidota bacterium]|nr:phosphatidate cytidylyltransferase [Bacteroidota bacterium]